MKSLRHIVGLFSLAFALVAHGAWPASAPHDFRQYNWWNDSSNGGVTQFLNSATFYAPLQTSLVLARGTGSPTFTRATVKTVFDHEPRMITMPAGAAAFGGVRVVSSLITTTSEDFNNAVWTKGNATITAGFADPFGGTSARKIVEAATTSSHGIQRLETIVSGSTYQGSIYVKAGERTWAVLEASGTGFGGPICYINLATGELGTNTIGAPIAVTPLANSWWRIGFTKASTTVSGGVGIYAATGNDGVSYAGDITKGIYAFGAQLQDVTGQANQTPSEYVSVGVLSAPYHGLGIDGIKAFGTLNGNTVSSNVVTEATGAVIPDATRKGYYAEPTATNLLLQSNAFTTTWANSGSITVTQNAVGPDGIANSAWTLTDTSGAISSYIEQSVTLTAAAHTISYRVKKTSGATVFPVIFAYVGTVYAPVTIDTNNGVATAWTAYTGGSIAGGLTASARSITTDYWLVSMSFTGTAAAWGVRIWPAATTNATQSTGVQDGTLTGSAVFYGAQLETGSVATSYIATTTGALARNADVLTYPFAGNALTSAGWAYVEASVQWNTSDAIQRTLLGFAGTGAADVMYVNNATRTTMLSYDGTNVVTATGLPDISSTRKNAASWGGAGLRVTGGGVVPATGSFDGAMPSASINIGGQNSGWNGYIKNTRIGITQPSDSVLQGITR